jgi:phosphatidylinositol-3-phosphatase
MIGDAVRVRRMLGIGTVVVAAAATLCVTNFAGAAAGVPRPDHVVIVMFENHEQSQVIGDPDAPYFNTLAQNGANFTASFAITHPSQPNYIAQFSGDTQGIDDDSCPNTFDADNLGNQLAGAGLTFAGYSEDLPSPGATDCTSGDYARKHSPWVNFSDLDPSTNQPFTSFPSDFSQLPTVSYVIPNLCNDMHDCDVSTGNAWLQDKLSAYADWAKANNSLLIVDFDEDDSGADNRIPTVFYGQSVKPGEYSENITHYSVLRTVEDMYDLPHLGSANDATTITDCWQ